MCLGTGAELLLAGGEVGLLVVGHLGIVRVDFLEDGDDGLVGQLAGKPLLVGGDHVPGGVL